MKLKNGGEQLCGEIVAYEVVRSLPVATQSALGSHPDASLGVLIYYVHRAVDERMFVSRLVEVGGYFIAIVACQSVTRCYPHTPQIVLLDVGDLLVRQPFVGGDVSEAVVRCCRCTNRRKREPYPDDSQ